MSPGKAYDTVVIGGGAAGMACALLQARRGRSVALVERAVHLAPTLRGFERQGTYFDTGFHYAGALGPGGLFRHLLEGLGLADALVPHLRQTPIYDRLRFAGRDREVAFPQGWPALEASLGAAFPADAGSIAVHLRRVRGLWEGGQAAFKADCGRDLGSLVTQDGLRLDAALGEVTHDPYAAAALACHAVLHGTPPAATSLTFHSLVVGSYHESAWRWPGGGRRWVALFTEALDRAGVRTVCGRAVVRLTAASGGGCDLNLADGTRLTGRTCIATLHPKALLDLVPAGVFRPAFRSRVAALEETASAVVLYGRRRGATPPGNLILIDEPRSLWDWSDRPPAERPLFLSAPVDSTREGISVICPASLADVPGAEACAPGLRPAAYAAWKQEVGAGLLVRLRAQAPDWAEGFDVLETAGPLTFRDWLASPAGGIYGIQHRADTVPLLPMTRLPGLYLSGQAVVAPGLLGALCAAFLTESCLP